MAVHLISTSVRAARAERNYMLTAAAPMAARIWLDLSGVRGGPWWRIFRA